MQPSNRVPVGSRTTSLSEAGPCLKRLAVVFSLSLILAFGVSSSTRKSLDSQVHQKAFWAETQAAIAADAPAPGTTVEIIQTGNASFDELRSELCSLPTGKQIAFIDRELPHQEALLGAIGADTRIIRLNSHTDLLTQIRDGVAGQVDLAAIHIVTHGEPGRLLLGGQTVLDADDLITRKDDCEAIRTTLRPNADVLIYGCNVAQGHTGEIFVNRLSAMLGADVAASDNLTGAVDHDGDWELEYVSGSIQTASLRPGNNGVFDAVLATFTVTTLSDEGDDFTIDGNLNTDKNDGDGLSLREALYHANNNGAISNVIELPPGLLRLNAGLDISKNVTIVGKNTIIDGTGAYGGLRTKSTETGLQLRPPADPIFSIYGKRQEYERSLDLADTETPTLLGSTIAGNISVTLKNLVIQNGEGYGGGNLYTYNAKVTLKNCSILNGRAIAGGGIAAIKSDLTLDNTWVAGNEASRGGGIFGNSSNISLINGSSVTNNQAYYYSGGGILSYGSWPSYYAYGAPEDLNSLNRLTVDNSDITGNYGGGIGAAFTNLVVRNNASISNNISRVGGGITSYFGGIDLSQNVSVDNNVGYDFAGGILSAGNILKIQDSVIRNNRSNGGGSGLMHRYGPAQIRNSKIQGNIRSDGYGFPSMLSLTANTGLSSAYDWKLYSGATALLYTQATMENCVVSNNTGIIGGGISAYTADLTVDRCDIFGNRAMFGGGIASGGNFMPDSLYKSRLLVTNLSNISGNEAYSGGGILLAQEFGGGGPVYYSATDGASLQVANLNVQAPYARVEDSLVTNNQAYYGGGLLVMDNGGAVPVSLSSVRPSDYYAPTMVVNNSIVGSNRATSFGGGIGNDGGYLIVENDANIVNNEASYGGGIAANGYSVVYVAESAITQNRSYRGGGGVYSQSSSSLYLAGGTDINSNNALNGGGVFSRGSLEMTNAEVQNNIADSSGGGVYAAPYSTAVISGSTVQGNTASFGGGILNGNDSYLILTDSIVSDSTASNWGGGIENYGSMVIANSTIKSNNAGMGGGIENHRGGYMDITNSVILDNVAPYAGGISNLGYLSFINLANSVIQGNSANYGGGIGNYSSMDIANSVINGNSANYYGGGIQNQSFTYITDSFIESNSSSSGGGIQNTGQLYLNRSTVSNNTSDYGDGGGLNNSGTAIIRHSTINSNASTYAHSNGGGIANDYGTAIIQYSTVSDNTAAYGKGGGIYINGGDAYIEYSTLSNNTAGSRGGGVYSSTKSYNTNMRNTTISGNSAFAGGGIAGYGGGIDISHSTVTANSAESGGGIDANSVSYFGTNHGVYLFSSIIAGNTADYDNDIRSNADAGSSYNLIGDPASNGGITNGSYYNIVGDGVGGILDPVLGPLQDNGGPTFTHRLLSGSPAIDQGPPLPFAASYDQRGNNFQRKVGSFVDIGAFEWSEQEIDVRGNGISIASGSASTREEDHTYFGKVSWMGDQTISRTFTIRNDGDADLSISGIGIIDQVPTSVFTLNTTGTMTSLSTGESTTFSVTFSPDTRDQLHSATVRIENNDPDENPYTFQVEATGGNAPPVAVAETSDNRTKVGRTVTLTGSNSYDPDSLPDPLTFDWVCLSGPVQAVRLTDNSGDAMEVLFTPQEPGTYVFELTVCDGEDTDTDTVTVKVGKDGIVYVPKKSSKPWYRGGRGCSVGAPLTGAGALGWHLPFAAVLGLFGIAKGFFRRKED